MKTLTKEKFTVSISGDIANAIKKYYEKEDYSLMIENFFRLVLPKKVEKKGTQLSAQLRGCAFYSGFVDKTDKEIKEIIYKEKYGV